MAAYLAEYFGDYQPLIISWYMLLDEIELYEDYGNFAQKLIQEKEILTDDIISNGISTSSCILYRNFEKNTINTYQLLKGDQEWTKNILPESNDLSDETIEIDSQNNNVLLDGLSDKEVRLLEALEDITHDFINDDQRKNKKVVTYRGDLPHTYRELGEFYYSQIFLALTSLQAIRIKYNEYSTYAITEHS